MKKLFILFTLSIGITASIFGQATAFSDCAAAADPALVPHTGTTPGLSPSDTSLPCAVVGVAVSDTIYFTNYTSLTYMGIPITMNSLQIDSLFLPTGLCWHTNKASNTFAGGENGVIVVNGTTNVSAGQYKLRIIVTANTSLATLSDIDAEKYAGLAFRVRVIDNTIPCCPPIRKTNASDSAAVYIAYNTSFCPSGINTLSNDVSNVSVVPNPFSSTAKVTFNSDVEGTFTVRMMNLLGATVSTKEVSVTRGTNEFSVERNGLSSGIYILSMSNGSSSISRKVIIE